MPRASDRFYGDTPHTGGLIFIGPQELMHTSDATTAVMSRNLQGDYSLNRIASAAELLRFAVLLPNLLRPINEPVDLQEQFGGSVGPIPVAGRPPFTGATQLIPPTSWPAKGVRIEDVFIVYKVAVVALTSASFVLDRTEFVNVVAPAVTSIPIDSTTLILATDANPYLITRAVTTPTFFETDNEVLIAEFRILMANTGAIRVYGIGFHVSFNYD